MNMTQIVYLILLKKLDLIKLKILNEANCYLLNTCHIRDKAKEKVYHEIGRVKEVLIQKKNHLLLLQDVLPKLKMIKC